MNGVQSSLKSLAIAALIAAAACARPSNEPNSANSVSPTTPVAIVVQNDNYLDMDIFASSNGMTRRLGTVMGTSKETFTIDPMYTIPNVRITARPIGGFGAASSGSLSVEPGDTVEMNVPAILR